MVCCDLEPGHPEVTRTAAIALWMAIWWMTEAIPIPVTALLPLVCFPFLGIMSGKNTASYFVNPIIFLFIGGFIVALAMERWNLHRRIALKVLMTVGVSPVRILWGFMGVTWFLSMWLSNTATAMMMVPIVLAVILNLEETFGRDNTRRLSTGLLLGVAYGASIGGIATLIGTPPNLAFSQMTTVLFPAAPDISFAEWMSFAFPVSILLLCSAWAVLYLLFCRDRKNTQTIKMTMDRSVISREYRALGSMAYEEIVVLVVFGVMAALWMTRIGLTIGDFTLRGWADTLGVKDFVDDGTVAILCAVVLFIIPARNQKHTKIMDWEATAKLPWGIVLLFGGGFALAAGFKASGLSAWLGQQMNGFGQLPVMANMTLISGSITFLTELTSNTATTQTALPILGAIGQSIRVNPLLLMIPATLSASCAFMLPVATPPNAIIFGTHRLSIGQMAKAGILLNLIGIVIIVLWTYFLAGAALHIDVRSFPDWATSENETAEQERQIVETTVIGRSVQNQPIPATCIGSGSRIVVVVGAIHGSEMNTAILVDNLVKAVSERTDSLPSALQLYFVPRVNPDGLERHSRYNANGVDLNRNWETNDWQPDAPDASGLVTGSGGHKPFSEPETTAFSTWLLNLRDKSSERLTVFFYHSAYPPSGLVQPGYRLTEQGHITDPNSATSAQLFAHLIGYPYSPTFDSYKITGEAIHWCADHDITCMDVELPGDDTLDITQIEAHVSAILETIRGISGSNPHR